MSRISLKYLRPSTNSEILAVQFLVSSFAFLLLGGALGLGLRAEVSLPAVDLMGADAYSRLFTNHGSITIFLWLMPAIAGLTHALLPRALGVDRMALPRLGAFAFWLMPLGGLLILVSFFFGGASSGWTAYAPLSVQRSGFGQTLWAVSLISVVLSLGFSSTNFLATVLSGRRKVIWEMPQFGWATLASSALALISAPILLVGLVTLVLNRLIAGSTFLASSLGLTLWQNAFWFFAHPATYIMLLPTIGVVSEIIQKYSGKPLVAHRSVAMATLAIAGLGLLSWGQHMFASGLIPSVRVPFMIASMAVAIPMGFILFAWLATLWTGRVQFDTPMLFALGFISMFLLAGLSGMVLASIPANLQLHDSYFVLGHSHFALFGGVMSGLFAGIYYAFPMITGRGYDERLGKLHFLAHFGGVHMAFLPMFILGLLGTPRRVFDFDPDGQLFQLASTGGALMLAGAAFLFLYNLYFAWRSGKSTVRELA